MSSLQKHNPQKVAHFFGMILLKLIQNYHLCDIIILRGDDNCQFPHKLNNFCMATVTDETLKKENQKNIDKQKRYVFLKLAGDNC